LIEPIGRLNVAKKSRKAKRRAPARKKKGMGFEIRCGPTVTPGSNSLFLRSNSLFRCKNSLFR
jgi:hypothetical protein